MQLPRLLTTCQQLLPACRASFPLPPTIPPHTIFEYGRQSTDLAPQRSLGYLRETTTTGLKDKLRRSLADYADRKFCGYLSPLPALEFKKA